MMMMVVEGLGLEATDVVVVADAPACQLRARSHALREYLVHRKSQILLRYLVRSWFELKFGLSSSLLAAN